MCEKYGIVSGACVVVKLWCDQYYPTVKLMVWLCTGHDYKMMSPEILSRDDSE